MTDPERTWHLFCTIASVKETELHTALENAKDHFKMHKAPPSWVAETIDAYYHACLFAQTRFDNAATKTNPT
ncbi:MAG: hypothetical protein RI897_3998 [Verrucomicrobiota bacterium]|jgi:hypothetical protein